MRPFLQVKVGLASQPVDFGLSPHPWRDLAHYVRAQSPDSFVTIYTSGRILERAIDGLLNDGVEEAEADYAKTEKQIWKEAEHEFERKAEDLQAERDEALADAAAAQREVDSWVDTMRAKFGADLSPFEARARISDLEDQLAALRRDLEEARAGLAAVAGSL